MGFLEQKLEKDLMIRTAKFWSSLPIALVREGKKKQNKTKTVFKVAY